MAALDNQCGKAIRRLTVVALRYRRLRRSSSTQRRGPRSPTRPV